jgi:hydrogenase maturation factor
MKHILLDNSYGYQSLAESVVLQAVKDYTNSYREVLKDPGNKKAAKMMQECEDFIESRWFRMLCNLDPEELLYKIDVELEKVYGRRK